MIDQEISLQDFVKILLIELEAQNIPVPMKDERKWHLLFFRLKRAAKDEEHSPEFLSGLRFDWNGPTPRSPELSDILQALHVNACVAAANPRFDEMSVNADVAKIWKSRYSNENAAWKPLVGRAATEAGSIFGSH